MTTEPNVALVEALERFLLQAKEAVGDEAFNRAESLPLTPKLLAQRLADLPACREADAIAHSTAVANNYLVTSVPRRRRASETASTANGVTDATTTSAHADDKTAEPAGRPLDADALIATGVLGLLQSRLPHDLHVVSEELASYLAGPPVDIWDYAVLDANLTTDDPVEVIDGWHLVAPTTEDLSNLLPLPVTADHQPNRPFKPTDYAHLTMLRRTRDERPHHGPLLRFDLAGSIATDRRTYPLWRPLLLLSLFDNAVLQLWARYLVEPGRRIDQLFDDVQWDMRVLDADTDYERPQTGDFGDDADLPMLGRFLGALAPRMPADLTNQQGRQEDKATARLRRCAEHFLSAGARAHGEGEVLSELNAETVLHYVIALEGLLTGEEQPGELTRKVSQRAAMLAGENDSQRLEIEQTVRDAYNARSKYAHGASPTDPIDLPKLRQVVRRCLLARLVIGDPTPGGTLLKVGDQALLSHEILEHRIRQPLEEFWRRVRNE